MNEHSHCWLSITGDKDFLMSSDKKGDHVTAPNGDVPYGHLSRSCFYCLNLIPVAPLEIYRFVKVM